MIDHTELMDVGATLEMLVAMIDYAQVRNWTMAEQHLAQIESRFHETISIVVEQGANEFRQLIIFGDLIDLTLRVPKKMKDRQWQRISDRLLCLRSLVWGMWNQLPVPIAGASLLEEPRPQPMSVFRSLARYGAMSVGLIAEATRIASEDVWSVLVYLRELLLITPFSPPDIQEYLQQCLEHPRAIHYQLSASGVSLAKDLRIGKRKRAVVYQIGSHPEYHKRVTG